ncbi:MAG: Peptidoglycan-N-acetylmuramic acid deacetylase PdaA precursor [Firmicutes bacterium ADurb.Bin456]|nr:MAG: Peptidoglycan-N-acetylmuramic acid deacetylase PdaA precursor [Firmicutes bacterium ADurb.Bin456]
MRKLNTKRLYLVLMIFLVLGVSGYAIKALSGESGPEPPGNSELQQQANGLPGNPGADVSTQGPTPAVSGGGEKEPKEEKNSDGGPNGAGSTPGENPGKANPPGATPPDKGAGTAPALSENLSNTKIGWGLKRNDSHQQPEMSASTNKLFGRYGAYWVGKPDKKVVYLTFDEGYENGYTPSILDTLKANDVKAAFFVTGHYLKSQPDLVRRMVEEGHIVGNHTDTHPSLPDINDEKIKQELQVVEKS